MHKLTVVLAALLALTLSAGAQTKYSAKVRCEKGDPVYTIPIGDKAGHALGLTKTACTWTPMDMAGTSVKTGVSIYTLEATSTSMTINGYHVATLANGDTWTVRFTGSAKLDKSGNILSGEGKDASISGTGKVKGIKGSGTFKGVAAPDGSVTYDVDGEYTLPASKP